MRNFQRILETEYCKIDQAIGVNALIIKWLPSNCHLSEWEFLEQNDILFNAIDVFNTTVLIIDAYDFCYPISDHGICQIEKHLDASKLKSIGIVISNDVIGKFQTIRLTSIISLLDIKLNLFKTMEEGQSWLTLEKIL